MKKRYLAIGLLATAFQSFGQKSDSGYHKKQLSHSDVSAIFSYYTQDNDHSAVTGGIGTEDLQVYAFQIGADYIKDSVRTVSFNVGFDVISSASTDNIDFVMSSASRHDIRSHSYLGYSRFLNDKRTTLGGGISFSLESDYLSWGQSLFLNRINERQTREVSASLQLYFDDLRWGRFQGGKPITLIYPVELRNTEWFDIYRRNSYNLMLGVYQTINKRMALGFYPGISYQSGLLSTPFHRVFFDDNSKRVENLPPNRVKIPIGLQLNTFVGTRMILRTYYRYYWDDFGISSHTINLEAPVKMTRVVTLTPFLRLYNQSMADFFKPYAEHNISQEFYTSDYDLSHFHSIAAGLGFRYSPYSRKKLTTFKEVELRFMHYDRSDGLTSNTISLFFNYDKAKEKKLE
ncbi:MAG: DUF3570 domain-containing protein [Cyclobacteriaceae bacterium]